MNTRDGSDYESTYWVSYEAMVIFMVIIFQPIVVAISFSKAKPYRKQICTNWPFFLALIIFTLFDIWVVFYPGGNSIVPHESVLYYMFNIYNFKDANGNSNYSYRFILFGLIILNSLLTFCVERFFISRLTIHYDKKIQDTKQKNFDELMESLQKPEIFTNLREKM